MTTPDCALARLRKEANRESPPFCYQWVEAEVSTKFEYRGYQPVGPCCVGGFPPSEKKKQPLTESCRMQSYEPNRKSNLKAAAAVNSSANSGGLEMATVLSPSWPGG
jgi:hypothetical protein